MFSLQWLTQRRGVRVKLLAADGNCIDGMFLDRRNKSLGTNHYGNKLVTMLWLVCSDPLLL